MKNREGFALVVAIFFVVVFAILGIVAVSLISGENILAVRDYSSIRAFHLAEAGLRYTMAASLAADSDWSDNTGFSKTLSPGYFTITYLSKAKRRCTLQCTGVVGGISRTIIASLKKSGLPGAFDYAVCTFNYDSETLYIQNTSTIYGDFWYDGPVIMQNSSKLLNGTMFSDSLTLQHSAYCASWEPITPVEPIVFDSTYYDNLIAETTKSATSALDLDSGTMNLSGGTYYYTSITIRGSATVNGPGTLVATTGDFTLKNSGIIGDDVMLIVKGNSYMQNSSQVGADFNLISQSNISVQNSQTVPAEAIFFSYGDITFDNTAYFWGSIMAPSGEISSVNSTTFNGLLYGDTLNLQNSTHLNGSAAVGSIGYFKNSTVVTYDPSKFPSAIPQGFEGAGESTEEGLSFMDWTESF
jgi:hypothetical protein